jgi:hypothetical protein
MKDYSWWNLRDNQALAAKLILKAIAVPAFANSKVYDVETPYLHGYLRKGQLKNGYEIVEFTYELNGKTNTVSVLTSDTNVASKALDMLSTIQPVVDIDKGYQEMDAQYKHIHKTEYPKELLLLSLISIKEPTADTLKALLQIEKEIDDKNISIDGINHEISYLESSRQ